MMAFEEKGFLRPAVVPVGYSVTLVDSHCVTTRKVQMAVQAATVGEGRGKEDSGWGKGEL